MLACENINDDAIRVENVMTCAEEEIISSVKITTAHFRASSPYVEIAPARFVGKSHVILWKEQFDNSYIICR